MAADYEDGSCAECQFVSGVNTDDWWGKPAILAKGICAWMGLVEDMPIFAYLSWWSNPYPERVIKAIRFSPAVKDADKPRLILLGVTGRRMSNGKTAKFDAAGIRATLATTGMPRPVSSTTSRNAAASSRNAFVRTRKHLDKLSGRVK